MHCAHGRFCSNTGMGALCRCLYVRVPLLLKLASLQILRNVLWRVRPPCQHHTLSCDCAGFVCCCARRALLDGADEARAQGEISRLDQNAVELDRQVKAFMEQIKERKHALACERATHETKIDLIGQERARLAEKMAMTQKTISSLTTQLR